MWEGRQGRIAWQCCMGLHGLSENLQITGVQLSDRLFSFFARTKTITLYYLHFDSQRNFQPKWLFTTMFFSCLLTLRYEYQCWNYSSCCMEWMYRGVYVCFLWRLSFIFGGKGLQFSLPQKIAKRGFSFWLLSIAFIHSIYSTVLSAPHQSLKSVVVMVYIFCIFHQHAHVFSEYFLFKLKS